VSVGYSPHKQERENATEVEARSEHSQISNPEEDGAAGQERPAAIYTYIHTFTYI